MENKVIERFREKFRNETAGQDDIPIICDSKNYIVGCEQIEQFILEELAGQQGVSHEQHIKTIDLALAGQREEIEIKHKKWGDNHAKFVEAVMDGVKPEVAYKKYLLT